MKSGRRLKKGRKKIKNKKKDQTGIKGGVKMD